MLTSDRKIQQFSLSLHQTHGLLCLLMLSNETLQHKWYLLKLESRRFKPLPVSMSKTAFMFSKADNLTVLSCSVTADTVTVESCRIRTDLSLRPQRRITSHKTNLSDALVESSGFGFCIFSKKNDCFEIYSYSKRVQIVRVDESGGSATTKSLYLPEGLQVEKFDTKQVHLGPKNVFYTRKLFSGFQSLVRVSLLKAKTTQAHTFATDIIAHCPGEKSAAVLLEEGSLRLVNLHSAKSSSRVDVNGISKRVAFFFLAECVLSLRRSKLYMVLKSYVFQFDISSGRAALICYAKFPEADLLLGEFATRLVHNKHLQIHLNAPIEARLREERAQARALTEQTGRRAQSSSRINLRFSSSNANESTLESIFFDGQSENLFFLILLRDCGCFSQIPREYPSLAVVKPKPSVATPGTRQLHQAVLRLQTDWTGLPETLDRARRQIPRAESTKASNSESSRSGPFLSKGIRFSWATSATSS